MIPVLAIDDEPGNLEIITDTLEDEGYAVTTAESGEAGLKILHKAPNRFQVILLDWMMPGMDGIEVLHQLKSHPKLRHIPVIMQTARTAHEDMLKGMEAGAFYYLPKPYQAHTLRTLMAAAVSDGQRYLALQQEIQHDDKALQLLTQAHFRFQSLDEAKSIATCLAHHTATPESVLMGLSELLINAIEHGNLGITYEEKSHLNKEGRWHEEVLQRLIMPEYKDRFATLHYQHENNKFIFTITDQGQGFDPEQYFEMDQNRIYDTHGRGIYMAKLISFDGIEYQNNGTRVIATVSVKSDSK